MRVLIGCEESQAVCKEFRRLGHEAYSCDIQECSGGHPEWHYQQDIFEVIKLGWDMMICFPPCTHLACSGAQWFPEKIKDGRQQQGIDFFMAMINAPIERIAVENPIGIMSTLYKAPTQIIQPYFFGDEVQKTTCIWLKNLPLLVHVKSPDLFNENVTHVAKGDILQLGGNGKKRMSKWYAKTRNAKERSKTFPGIARAMAEQWGKLTPIKTV